MTTTATEPLIGTLLESLRFAATKHRGQCRKDPDKTPYINHPIEVAHLLWHEGGVRDVAVLQAAVLHDTVEDTNTSFEEVEANFGPHIRQIVEELTDDPALDWLARKKAQVIAAPHASQEAKLVKLADKICNVRDIHRAPPIGWSEKRQAAYFEWAWKVVAGLRGVNPPLETLFDEIYQSFQAKQGEPSRHVPTGAGH